MAENCPNTRKKIVTVVQEAERVPSKINPRRNTLRHIVIKLTNTKEKFFFTATREKQQITYRGTPVRILVDFSAETLQARRQLHEIFKVKKGKTYKQEYSTPKGLHSDSMEKSKALQISKS